MEVPAGIFIISLRYLFFMLSIVPICLMDGDFVDSMSSSWSLDEAIEIQGPTDFRALSGDLMIYTKLSSSAHNLGRIPSSLYLQLLFKLPDMSEDLLATKKLRRPISTLFEKIVFECYLIVQGGDYVIRIVDQDLQEISNKTIKIQYPTITFEVPHRVDAYTTSTPVIFGFTRSTACEPSLPLPPTVLVLSICTRRKTDSLPELSCDRDFKELFQEPLKAIQREGQVRIDIGCEFWARNATYVVQIRARGSNEVIARSRPILSEWGSQFQLTISRRTVMPCRENIIVAFTHPNCTLPGKDKIRVYGYETLSVPSALVPSRVSYIKELQIQPNRNDVTFSCDSFAQRFLRFCFQYVNTAVDGSVAVVMEKCVPTNPPMSSTEGGWGSWSPWTECTTTCGAEGRQFRYRFCDNPPPSSGANFCQGDAIEEKPCDNQVECPEQNSVVYVDNFEELSTPISHHGPRYHRIENVTITPGCECGCILYDLVPGRNETLVIFISSNHSSPCADEDEVDHHKFKWIFHTKNDEDRVHLEVVDMETQCVTITFRDGNTTDSNLLQVITSPEAESHYQEILSQSSFEEQLYEPLTLESTGASLSIATTSDTYRNCSGQFIYFIAYYSTLPSPNASLVLSDSRRISVHPESFSALILLKFVLIIFFLIVLLSTLGGCFTKAYRKAKYKKLKCLESDDDGVITSALEDDSSRCTSVTLMSFDYSYWRRLRLLRLKYFLLKPRPISTATVKSFPTTPTHHVAGCQNGAAAVPKTAIIVAVDNEKRLRISTSDGKGANAPKSKYRLSKSISLSESNLRSKAPLEKESEKNEGESEKRTVITTKVETGERMACGKLKRKEGEKLLQLSMPGKKSHNEKLKKEQENLLRRQASRNDMTGSRRKLADRKPASDKGSEGGLNRKRSQISVVTSSQNGSSCGDDESRVASRAELEDTDQDFEMDYYDYDVMNAGTIPGSYLGLEPAFVLWNSEVYQSKGESCSSSDQEQEEHEMDRLISSASTSSHDKKRYSSDCDIEMTATRASSSQGIFSESRGDMTIRETSLDTLKFADDEDGSDMGTSHGSDSAWDQEQELMSESPVRQQQDALINVAR